jgi:tRNA(Ile)-lysidine synthase
VNKGVEAIERKISSTIHEWDMLPRGCTVVAGLSGGADSVTMTHFFSRHASEYGIKLTAAHVNHGLRGKDADSDEQFVRSFCENYSIPLHVLNADVRSIARQNSQGIEECGRNIRYSFFRSLCGENGRIATAHTLSDSAETSLMNLAKGAGAKGLCGIPPVRGNIIRPIIGITRGEVEEYCKFYSLQYVTDRTNFDDSFARNKIRLHVMPVLREINPEFENSAARASYILRSDEEYLDSLALEGLRKAKALLKGGAYRLDELQQMPHAVLLHAISIIFGKMKKSRPDFSHITAVERIINSGAGSVTCPGGIQCAVSGNTFFAGIQQHDEYAEWSVPFSLNRAVLPDGRSFELHKVSAEAVEKRQKINKLLFNNLINYDTILNMNKLVRSRRPGDAYRPARRGVKKTLKKLFNEAKVPVMKRCRRVVFQCGDEIVWVEGFGVSQEACVSENTKNIAEIIIKECR